MGKHNAKNKTENAISQIRYLLQHLFRDTNQTRSSNNDWGKLYIPVSGGPAIRLSREQSALHEKCISKLLLCYGDTPGRSVASRETLESLVDKAMGQVIIPSKSDAASRDSRVEFDRRVTIALDEIRAYLSLPAEEWVVAVRIDGFGTSALPLVFGKVTIAFDREAVAQEMTARFGSAESELSADRANDEIEIANRSREELSDAFAKGIVATTAIHAADGNAARLLGIEEVRQTVDAINFFAPLLGRDSRRFVTRAHVPPDGARATQMWAAHRTSAKGIKYNLWNRNDWRVASFDMESQKGMDAGVTRAHEIFFSRLPSSFERRIRSAIVLAGRARVEHRRDSAFLFFAISLEALLVSENTRGGVSERIRQRMAVLLGVNEGGKRWVRNHVAKLYDLRSGLVHAGNADAIGPDELDLMSTLVESVLVFVLTDARFRAINDGPEFERWLDDEAKARNEAPEAQDDAEAAD